MQLPLSQAARDLNLMPDPNAEMDAQKTRRQKEKDTAADDSPAAYGDRAFSSAVNDLLGLGRR